MIISGKKTEKRSFVSDFAAGFSEKFNKNRKISTTFRQNLSKKLKTSGDNTRLALKSGFLSTKSSVFAAVNTSKIIRPLSIALISFFFGLFAGLTFSPTVTTSALAEQGIEPVSPTEISRLDSKPQLEKSSLPEISTDSAYSTPRRKAYLTNSSQENTSSFTLEIPSISLKTNVTFTYVDSNNEIIVPASSVGSLTSYHSRTFYNKSVLVGHRTGIFAGLGSVSYGDQIFYFGKKFTVTNRYQKVLTTSDMRTIIADSMGPDTIVLITCAGPNYSERLVITAEAI